MVTDALQEEVILVASPVVKGVMVSRRQCTASGTKDQPEESSDVTRSLSPHGGSSDVTPQGRRGVTIRSVPLFTTDCSVEPDEMQALIHEAAELQMKLQPGSGRGPMSFPCYGSSKHSMDSDRTVMDRTRCNCVHQFSINF